MANHRLEVATSIQCGYDFAMIVQHFGVNNPTETNAYKLAKEVLTALGNPGVSDYVGNLAHSIGDDCFIQAMRVRQLAPTSGQTAVQVYGPADLPGDFGTDHEASQVAGCVIWLTAADAGLNGRTFVPGVPEDALVQGRFTAGYKSAIQSWADIILAGITFASGELNLYLKHGVLPAVYTEITNGYISPTPGTQRRRLVPI